MFVVQLTPQYYSPPSTSIGHFLIIQAFDYYCKGCILVYSNCCKRCILVYNNCCERCILVCGYCCKRCILVGINYCKSCILAYIYCYKRCILISGNFCKRCILVGSNCCKGMYSSLSLLLQKMYPTVELLITHTVTMHKSDIALHFLGNHNGMWENLALCA